VLDPFTGIGTTALTCVRLRVSFLGFEIDPFFVEIVNEKLSRKTLAYPQKAQQECQQEKGQKEAMPV
jgi:DNA modification methylase